MTKSRPRLILLPGDSPIDPHLLESLRSVFKIAIAKDHAHANQLAKKDPKALVLSSSSQLRSIIGSADAEDAHASTQDLGDGMGVVSQDGELKWTNSRLKQFSQQVRHKFSELCCESIELFNEARNFDDQDAESNNSHRFSFQADSRHYELVVSPASSSLAKPEQVDSVIGVLWDVTASRRILDKLDAVDAGGSDLLRFEPEMITKLNAAERLKILEQKIALQIKELLGFDSFQIRLIDRETNRLELVMFEGIAPERIGEAIYPELQGNGITGHVAASGQSYICTDVKVDPLYREGLDDAASSLTVPLRLHDKVIGVFNIESDRTDRFDENDRRFATLFGRYVAMAMNILDLLVAERYTTNEQMSRTVLGELADPIAEINDQALAMRKTGASIDTLNSGLDHIIDATGRILRKVESCTSGPRTILGAEHELQWGEPDPQMKGKRILVADDDKTIRTSVEALLTHKGCSVIVCEDGTQTLERLKEADDAKTGFDLVISDIKMPGHSGYEVFVLSKELSPDTPVILMTGFGYDPHHSIVRASQQGLQSFLFKPFKATQLIEEVKKALVDA
ncbi:MAG: response regulator [Planctomycetes bacterium]|nr:response regulator [Planctomycetota bacterium]